MMTVQNGAVASWNTVDKQSDKNEPELKLPPSVDRSIAEQLVEQARADGVDLVGLNGLLGQLTKQVLETGLEVEMDEHLGYEKHAVEGRDGQLPQRDEVQDGDHRGRAGRGRRAPGPGRDL